MGMTTTIAKPEMPYLTGGVETVEVKNNWVWIPGGLSIPGTPSQSNLNLQPGL